MAQHPVSIQIGERDGLPSSTVFDIFQDSLGYIWLGTDIGLVRYDSYSFQHYDKSEVPPGAIAVLQTDSRNRLWFMNFNNQIFYLDGDSIIKPAMAPLPSLRFFHIIDDVLYAYTYTDIYRYDIGSGADTFVFTTQGDTSFATGLFPPTANLRDEIVFTTRHHLLNFWSEGGIKKTVPHLPEFIDPKTGAWDSRIVVLPDRVLVHGFGVNKLFEYRNGHFSNIDLSPFSGAVKAIHYTPDGLLWFSTNDELWVTDANYKPLFDRPIFPGSYVTKVILDDVGNYWIGTHNNGLHVVPSLQNHFYNTANSNIAGEAVHRLQRGKGNDLLIGFPRGTFSLKRGGEHVFINRKVDSEQEVQAMVYLPRFESVLVSATITFELPYDLGSDRPSDRITFKEMVEDEAGNIWMASSNGVYVYTAATGNSELPAFTKREDKVLGRENRLYHGYRFGKSRSRAVAYDSLTKSVYLGFADNLVRMGPGWEQTPVTLGDKPIVAADIVCKNGKVYVGTVANGLVILENDRVVRHYHKDNAPLFNYISALAVTNNHVWIATSHGLFLLDEVSGKWRTFRRSEGLISNEITDMAAIGNRLWLGTPLGLQSMPLHGFVAQKPVRVYIEHVATFDKTPVSHNAHLPHTRNDILINITGLSYPYNRDARLEYRLLGQSDNWTRIPASQRQVTFLGLSPGDYSFEIRPVDDPAARVASFTFFIDKPFWMQTWFLLISGATMAMLLYLIYRQRIRARDHKNRLLLKAAQLETDLRQSELAGIKSQMNPHFIFNALNSIQGYFLEDDKEKANEILGKFSDLMRKILYQSQQECIALTEEIEALELYLQIEQARLGEEFTFELHNDCTQPAHDISIPSMIIQPFVENAVKHGLLHRKGEKRLRISFSEVDGSLHVEIDDNGVGRTQAGRINKMRRRAHQSFAISANQKRLELLNRNREKSIALKIEDKYDQMGRATGTLVLLNIPLEKNE